MSHFGEQIVAIMTAIISLAILSVLLSKNSNTANVIATTGSAFGDLIKTATSPVTGSIGNFGFTGINGIPDIRGSVF